MPVPPSPLLLDEINMLEDVVSIPGILTTYVPNKLLRIKDASDPELFAPGQPCFHKCKECEVNPKPSCEKCKKVRNDCMQCVKNKPYELLKTNMIGGPSIVFCLYHGYGKSRTHSQQYDDAKTCAKVVGFNVNSLYLNCSGQEMPCGEEHDVEVYLPNNTEELCNQIMSCQLFGFFQVDMHVSDELIISLVNSVHGSLWIAYQMNRF